MTAAQNEGGMAQDSGIKVGSLTKLNVAEKIRLGLRTVCSGVLFADAVLPISGVFCPFFVILLSLLNPRPFAQSFFDVHAPRQPGAVSDQINTCTCIYVVLSCFIYFFVFGDVAFPSTVYYCCFLFVWRIRRTLSFRMVFKKSPEHPPVRRKKG